MVQMQVVTLRLTPVICKDEAKSLEFNFEVEGRQRKYGHS